MSYTRFTNLEVTGSFKMAAIEDAGLSVETADATKAAGTAPTKAEFDAVVDLANKLKEQHNALLEKFGED